jgi:deoxyribose-phosphate aldolase
MNDLASRIEHTLLRPEATAEDVRRVCDEAMRYHFAGVCINPLRVLLAARLLSGSGVRVVSVAGFPLGASTIAVKCREATDAVEHGANEVDMVISVGSLKDGDFRGVEEEIQAVKRAVGPHPLKCIVETCLLTESEKANVLECVANGGADYIKTSTGFSSGGANLEDIRLFRRLSKGRLLIKASGGIRNLAAALAMTEAGADRLGTSSSVMIMEQLGNTSRPNS